VTGGLQLASTGDLIVHDSVIDAGAGAHLPAITAADGELTIERATVWGAVNVRVIEASETNFVDNVTVEDRFHGCIRVQAASPRASVLAAAAPASAIGTRLSFVSIDRDDPGARATFRNLRPVPCSPAPEDGRRDGRVPRTQAGPRSTRHTGAG